jgi:hypothetical protein
MARPGFYNENMNRDYPFLHLETDDLPDSAICDFGCVMGIDSGFIAGTHSVWLAKIRSVNNLVEFLFETDAPGLAGQVLRFERNLTDPKYTTSYEDAVEADQASQIDCNLDCDSSIECVDDPEETCHGTTSWYGFLVTGDLEELIDSLPCTTVTCDTWIWNHCEQEYEIPIEPSLIQSLTDSFVRTINVANADRTRANAPEDCREYCWPFPITEHYIRCECMVGDLRLQAGYNTCIEVDELENTVTINACLGGGEGEPCEEVRVTDDEDPPEGRTTLDGALRCDEVVRSINGVGRRFFEILGGQGVVVTSLPEEHKIVVDINLQTLSICTDYRDQSSLVSESSSLGSCECGPL